MISCSNSAHGSSSCTSSDFLATPTSPALLIAGSPPASYFDLFDPFHTASPHLFPPLDDSAAASTASPCLSASDSSAFMAASGSDPSLFALSSSPHSEAFQMPYSQEMFHLGSGEELGPSVLSKKRFTMSDLEELMAEDEADDYLLTECESSVSSKRLRGANGWVTAGDSTAAAHSGESSNSPLKSETDLLDSSRNEGGRSQAVDKISKAPDQKIANGSFEASKSSLEDASILHCGDLDDILDILLKEEAATSELSRTVLSSSGPSRVSTNGSESSCRHHGILENGASTQFSNSVQHTDNGDLSFASTTASLQKEREVLSEREQRQIAHDRTPRRSWDWQAATREKPSTASTHSQPLASCSDLSHSSREQRSFKPNESVLIQQSQPKLLGCNRESVQIWAGPTLLELESILAMKDSSPLMYSAALINTITSSSLSSPLSECLDGEASRQKGASDVCEDAVHSGEFPSNEEQTCPSWRRLLKRETGEPKYTLKLRCEEEAVNDGYRWRKYGQKTIKSSPYPRSYYRCTSCKCTAKKQVERSFEDPRLLLVTYEGIHLHPQPNPLANCLSSHLVEQHDTLLHRMTCSSLSSSSSSSYVPTHLSSPNPTRDFGTLMHHCTSPPSLGTPRHSPPLSPCQSYNQPMANNFDHVGPPCLHIARQN